MTSDGGHDDLHLRELFIKAIEDTLTAEEFAELDGLMVRRPEVVDQYVQFMGVYIGLYTPTEGAGLVFGSGGASRTAEGIRAQEGTGGAVEVPWGLLARMETAAPAMPTEEPRVPAAPEARSEIRSPGRWMASRLELAAAVVGGVALMLLVITAWFSPAGRPVPVAVVSKTLEAKWWDEASGPTVGSRVYTGRTHQLLEGYAELTFDNGTTVLIEAPTEFMLEAGDTVFLRHGRLTARTPEGLVGFVVRTSEAVVVDYGTEFGVEASTNGETEVGVFEGVVDLRSGPNVRVFDGSLRLQAGQAARAASDGSLRATVYDESRYARRMPDAGGFAIPGRTFNLADVVGGGNGLGRGRVNYGIDPRTGRMDKHRPRIDRVGDGAYVPVPWSRYIDGVFVPVGGDQVISTTGYVFKGCPATNRVYHTEILNGPSGALDELDATLGGRAYGTVDHPCLFMHANLGITFDLDAIRAANPGRRIAAFEAIAGVAAHTRPADPCNASFWVLVDGQVRYRRLNVRTKGVGARIRVALAEGDRFLTLITTDGGDPDYGPSAPRGTHCDWCVFAEPHLVLK